MPIVIISRKDAKAKGLPHYFTGKPCINGHIDLRYTGRGTCRTCNLKFSKESQERHPERCRERRRKYRIENAAKIAAAFKRWYDNWMREKPGENVKKTQRWLNSRPNYRKDRRKNDPNFHIADTLRCRVRQALFRVGAQKSDVTVELIGCTFEFLHEYLEARFQPGMTWGNYGYGNDKWHIDHIRPCASFDLTDPAQQRACFNFSNLNPLWQPDNLRKGAKIYA